MSRPKMAPDERRDTQLPPARVTSAERAIIEEKAAIAGIPLSDFTRRAALGQPVSRPRSLANDRLLLELHRIGVNLNQIARALNSDRPGAQDLPIVIADLKRILAGVAVNGS